MRAAARRAACTPTRTEASQAAQHGQLAWQRLVEQLLRVALLGAGASKDAQLTLNRGGGAVQEPAQHLCSQERLAICNLASPCIGCRSTCACMGNLSLIHI